MKLSIVVTKGKPEGKEIPIKLNQFLIGRDPDCQLRPSNPLISKRHCAILVKDDKAYLQDFDSTNGTLINGQALKGEIEIKHGDEFAIGPLTFRIKMLQEDTEEILENRDTEEMAAADTQMPSENDEKTTTPDTQTSEDDAVADMLLNLSGEDVLGGNVTEIPEGSTIYELPTEKPNPEEAEQEETQNKKDDKTVTSDAARAILEQIMKGRRT